MDPKRKAWLEWIDEYLSDYANIEVIVEYLMENMTTPQPNNPSSDFSGTPPPEEP